MVEGFPDNEAQRGRIEEEGYRPLLFFLGRTTFHGPRVAIPKNRGKERVMDTEQTRVARKLSRRDFLKVGGAGLAGAALLGAAGCGGGGGGAGNTLVFSMGRDTSGTLQDLINKFNQQNKGNFQVSYREMPTDTGQYFDKLKTEFQAQESNIDVIGGDVIWPAQFAANGWIVDVSDRFPESQQSEFLPGPINSLIYEGKIYGVPWFTDAGMLYYRQDLLEQAGFSEPPKTWDELKDMAQKVSQDTGTQNGFVFQGSDYEGGVVDGLEYIWTHGGDVLQGGDKVVIDSPQAIAGLETERSMITSRVAPQAVTTYTETETDPAFMGGRAVFARNWPYMYALAGTSDYPKVKPDMVGVAPLPAGSGGQSVSGLGGWNMLISALSDMQDEAWEFVKFMTGEAAQKQRALAATLLPTRKSLYEDQEILSKVPVIRLGKEAIKRTKPRPVSPYYSDMSLKMADQFNASLKGEVSPEQAAETLQTELQQIIEQGG
jgi:multiple sugar transport system substrate-binding protein